MVSRRRDNLGARRLLSWAAFYRVATEDSFRPHEFDGGGSLLVLLRSAVRILCAVLHSVFNQSARVSSRQEEMATDEQVFEVVDGFRESLFRVGDDALTLCQHSALLTSLMSACARARKTRVTIAHAPAVGSRTRRRWRPSPSAQSCCASCLPRRGTPAVLCVGCLLSRSERVSGGKSAGVCFGGDDDGGGV